MTTLSGIKVPFPHIVSLLKPKSDSKICVVIGLLVSFAKPFPFLRSIRLCFGRGLVGRSSASCLRVGVGAAPGSDVGVVCGDGERRLGGEAAGWLLLSSSHVEIVISSRRRRPGRAVGVGSVEGGNNIVKYCWIIGLSFFLL